MLLLLSTYVNNSYFNILILLLSFSPTFLFYSIQDSCFIFPFLEYSFDKPMEDKFPLESWWYQCIYYLFMVMEQNSFLSYLCRLWVFLAIYVGSNEVSLDSTYWCSIVESFHEEGFLFFILVVIQDFSFSHEATTSFYSEHIMQRSSPYGLGSIYYIITFSNIILFRRP